MKTYNGDAAQKEMFQARFANHREMDEVIQGTGFDNGRGCFIGCTMNNYSHESFHESVAPRWIGYLADKIFEGLPKDEAPQFGTDLLAAIPIGIEYSSIDNLRHELSILRLEKLLPNVKSEAVISSIKLVIDSHKKHLAGESVDWSKVRAETVKTRRAAADAAYAAYAAYDAYAAAADAYDDAYAYAYDDAYDAYAAYAADAYDAYAAYAADAYDHAYDAAYAAAYAARQDHWRFERDNLLRLISSVN
jgi:hypothetical protein